MNDAVMAMLARYSIKTAEDRQNALHEIMQEIALLGLWRSKFFEHAAFYGGTALRILYGLDRFSEDLDFTLIRSNAHFSLTNYFEAVKKELESFGFEVEIESIEKKIQNQVDSAFIKANTMIHFIKIGAYERTQKDRLIRVKIEVDRDPPLGFQTEAKVVLIPTPFSVLTLSPEDLFAGKIHALLYRQWQRRVKGRDWYDFVWYIGRKTGMHLEHFRLRMIQSQKLNEDFRLDQIEMLRLIHEKIDCLDVELAKNDIRPFLRDSSSLQLWSKDFFHRLADQMTFI